MTSGRIVFGVAPPGFVCTKRPAAYAVITGPDGHVAAVRPTGRGYFWLPGGGSHPGETPEATVEREVREELGRQIKVTARVGEATQFFYASDDKCWYEMAATFFRAELDEGPVSTREDELCWVDSREQPELFFHASHVWAVSQVLSSAPEV